MLWSRAAVCQKWFLSSTMWKGSCCEKHYAYTHHIFHLTPSFLEHLFLLYAFQNLTIISMMPVTLVKSAATCDVTVSTAQDDLCSVSNVTLNRFEIIAVMFPLIFKY
jgi:hypothetical protein